MSTILSALARLAAGALVVGCTRPPAVGAPTPEGASVDLVVASTTDTHGRVRGWDYYADRPDSARGLARAATVIDSVRAAHPGRVVLVDAGDLLQGNPFTYVAARVDTTRPHGVVAAMNAMRYDAAAVGNHEFNYGLETFDRAASQARFPFLAANAFLPDGRRAYPAFRIVDRAGLKVGIVGATTPGALVWDRDNLRGRLLLRDAVVETRRAVAEARTAGADVIVVVIHSGLDGPSSYDTVTTGVPSENVSARIAREVPGIDLLVLGHSHAEVADTTIGTTLVMQPKNYATSVGVAHLTVSRANGRWQVTAKRGTTVPAAGHRESPAVLAATEGAHGATVAYATTPIGSTPVAWRADSARVVDTPLVDFMLAVMQQAAGTDLASTAAFSLDASLDAGPITVADVAQLYPYDNTLRAVRITGRQLRAYLEHSARYYRQFATGSTTAANALDPQVPGYNFDIVSGADYTLDVSRPLGSRVTRLELKGRPVADADTFTMALNNYRQTGGGGYAMLSSAPVVFDKQQEIRQLLIDEVRRRGTIRPEQYAVRNWTLVPAEAAAVAYRAMQGGTIPPASVAPSGRAAFPAGTRFLRIISTNDFHGALESRPDAQGVLRGGAIPMAAAIERARTECRPDCESIVLDGGDEFQGTPASNLAHGRPVVELFRALGYAASALGNHEFDWGVDTLRARVRQAPYAILGANVRYTDGRDVPWIRDDTLVTRGNVRIGIVGVATPETPSVSRPSNIEGLRFDPMAPIVSARARSLRARGADVVIVVAHSGGFCAGGGDAARPATVNEGCNGEILTMARELTEKVDAIVSGHTHSLLDTRVNGIPIVQARSSGRAVGVIDIPLPTGAVASRQQVRDVVADSGTRAPAAVETIVRRALAAVETRVNRPVASIADPMPRRAPQYALGNLIADAQRWAGKGDVAVMNNGGIRADLRAGQATYGSLFEIQPFGNTLYRVTVRGRDLRAYLDRLVRRDQPNVHVSGVTVRYDSTRAAGSRIVSATLDGGRAIDDARVYSVILSDFLVTGGDGLGLAGSAISTTPLNIVDLDALVGYLRSLPGPVRAPSEVRLRPASAGTP
jgi:2',3'-cyclic-nucleotide 2'-phosphodiesterase (5'-nucleotidase family)